VIDVAGVGYLVFCGSRTLAHLPGVGEAVEFFIETHVREDHIHLYGFSSGSDREMFRTLTTVQGVGAKVGLSILSALSAEQIAQAIAAGDQTAFKKVSGVGPKLAQRLVAELKDKMSAFAFGSSIAEKIPAARNGKAAGGNLLEDAVSALVNLGYGRMEAFGAVNRAAQAAGGAAPLGALIKTSLRELGGSDG